MLYWLVGLGGIAGSLLRYGVSELSYNFLGNNAAINVFICNIVGSFILAWLFVRIADLRRWQESVQLAIGTGLIGSFTTFSALSTEVIGMLESGAWLLALLFVTLSFVGGYVAAWLGWWLGQSSSTIVDKGEAKQ